MQQQKTNEEVDEGKLIQHMLDHCRAFLAKKTSQEDTVKQLRTILQNFPHIGTSLLFDVLVALQPEFDEERSLKQERADEIRALLEQIGKELLPSEILLLELNALGADTQQTRSKIVKTKTRLYYKQVKYNLLREESEGYAKLIAELLHPSTAADLMLVVDCLIGQFNLDPNRVLDIILECFEYSPHNRDLYIPLIREFKIDQHDLQSIVILKFIFCQKAEHTPMSIYRLVSLLAQEGLIDILAVFNLVNPPQKEIMDESKSLAELIRIRSVRAETISSSGAGLLAAANEGYPITSILSVNDSGPEPSPTAPAVSFSAAIQCQQNEDRKLAGSRFDDAILYKNQKLGLLCAVLEHGSWELAKPIFERLPEIYPFGVCKRIAMAVANLIGYMIEPFYRQKYVHYRDNVSFRMKESWERFNNSPEPVTDWTSLFNDALPIAFQIGPYIGTRHDIAIKLIRLLNLFYDDPEAETLTEYENYLNTIVDLFDMALVPAASLLDSNFAYSEEVWQILGRLPYQSRYRIYHRWRTLHTERCWDLNLQRGRVLGMTRYIMKRLSKDTAKVMGRQLGKMCHIYPTIPLDYLLSKVQDFQNFIGPVVESIRFLSSLEFDVLAYCLIENLAAPEKQDYKISDISYSPWLQSLANFAAAIFKRYALDFGGILQYIANQLKDTKNMDLIVLREIVTSISGVESSTDLTQEHLDALCGGDILRGEAGYLQMTKLNRRSINRLRDSLLKDGLFESLCILIGQQKQFIIFRDYKEYPLKLTTQMLDQCQEAFVQFFHFLRANLKPEQYAKQMPSAKQLLTEFHLPIELALCLTRPIYMNKIEIAYELEKKKSKENSKDKLDKPEKYRLYRKVFKEILEHLEDELAQAFPESYWIDMTTKLHTIFWLLAVNDLMVPNESYERGIDKCKRELQEFQQQQNNIDISSARGGQKRTAKDEERFKALEQKLIEEKRRQSEHVERIREILVDEKENFFGAQQNKASQMLRFFQCCILPRVICSEVDAVHCVEFVKTLHFIKTDFFQTIVFFDKIFTDVTPILAGLSERETMCFGRFCCLLLDTILRWHSSTKIFHEECDGYPGCVTKIRKKDHDEKAAADSFTYEFYRSICYKWQVRLTKSLGFMLSQQNYVLIRNALTLMIKILPNFPMLVPLNATIIRNVTTVRDNEKGNRHDLNLLASSYLVQLQKRNDQWEREQKEGPTGSGRKRILFENYEFSDVRNTKSDTGTKGVTAANGTLKRSAIINSTSGTDRTGKSSPIPSEPSASPPKRSSRPPIRSGGKNT